MEVFISICGIPHRNNECGSSAKRLTEMLCLPGEREYPSLFGLCSGRLDVEKHRHGKGSMAGCVGGTLSLSGAGASPGSGGCQRERNLPRSGALSPKCPGLLCACLVGRY